MTIYEQDFRSKSHFYLALMALVLLTPFAINNFIQGRYNLGVGSLLLVLVLAFNAWSINRGRFNPSVTWYGLIPLILIYLSIVLQKQEIIGVLWCYPSVICFYFILPEKKAWAANITLLIITLPQIWQIIEFSVAARATITLIAVSTFSAIFLRVITNQQRYMHTLAVTDALTGVHNRVLLHDALEEATLQGNRTDSPMTLISLDIDRFKEVNDSLGHDAGDIVLKGLGEYLTKTIRATDKVFRMGGEEFLVLLYGTEIEGSKQFAEKLRTEIASLALIPEQHVTVSIGVATLQSGEDRNKWMRRCDENLYRAKTNGRNKVIS
jgi:diguanylate cyclase (GGDEF)-like protein